MAAARVLELLQLSTDRVQGPEAGPLDGVIECSNILAQSAAALKVADPRPAALTAAALAAATAAQRAQDEEEAAFEWEARLAEQVAAARSVMDQLEALTAALDAAAPGLRDTAAQQAASAAAKEAKTLKYQEQQVQIAARLEAVGCCPEIGQTQLQARGRERGQLLAQLQRAEAELAHFQGLPADMAAAKAATLEKRAELERLRGRLHELLNSMQ